MKFTSSPWARGSVVEHIPDKNEVEGSIPSAPTGRLVANSLCWGGSEIASLLPEKFALPCESKAGLSLVSEN